MMIHRKLYLLLTLFTFSLVAIAQSGMTDNQVMDFVIKENERGTSREEIVTKLMQKGVDMQQIQRIHKQYEKQQDGSVLGAKDLTGTGKNASRLRKNNGDRREQKNLDELENFQKKSYQDKVDKRSLSEYQKAMLLEEEKNEFYDGLDFILPDSLEMYHELMSRKKDEKKQIFGRNIFNKKNLSFEPNMNIATPENYRLGPGDEIYIDIWGASQKTINSQISPEGYIDIEEYGPIHVNGLTVGEANRRLRSTLGNRYANSEIKLTVGQTRTITINVMGEVEAPGTYTVSAFATVFHALYMAGGVNDIGTLRNIQVWRGGKNIATVDIYDYILNGKLSGNIRLASDDIIIVGTYDCLVNITGKVKRPMFYEMKHTESVSTLIKYAGGFTGDAYKDNVRLIRKSEGEYTIYSLNEFERASFKLTDGDSLAIDSTLTRYRNMVEIKGAVFRPGMYQMNGDINTVRGLIETAGGTTEDAFTTRAVMHRRRADRSLEVVPINVAGLMENRIADIALRNEDILFIPSLKDAQDERTISIYGEIINPGIYQYAANTTLEDFILQAGGLKDAASTVKVDVFRRIRNQAAIQSSNVIAQSYSFSIKEGFVIDGKPGFVLEPFDEVFVRRSPGYVNQEHVTISGEVAFAGIHVLTAKEQRLSDLIKNAGGLTAEAYPKGARLERRLTEIEKIKRTQLIKLITNGDSIDMKKLELGDTRYVGIELDKALENPGSEWDIVVQEGDKLIIPQYNNTVTINGEVMYPNTVAYKEGEGLSYYISQAGGYNQKAKKKRVFSINMNGTVSRLKDKKDIQPGCEILVPAQKERNKLKFSEIIGLASVTATLGTVVATLLR